MEDSAIEGLLCLRHQITLQQLVGLLVELAAADAGCDSVLTRGQFHQQTDELLQRYLMA